jgi:hypothetical protein
VCGFLSELKDIRVDLVGILITDIGRIVMIDRDISMYFPVVVGVEESVAPTSSFFELQHL